MSYILDTNVVSELVKARPSTRVVRWVEGTHDAVLHLSVLTIGEIRKGVEAAPGARRREELRRWLEEDLPDWFGDRLLPISLGVAERWGRLLAEAGRQVPAIDSLLAATALHHDLRLVTRNEGDFDYPGLIVVNPWT